MKFHALLAITATLLASLASAEVPKALTSLFSASAPVKARVGMVLPPPEIDKFIAKVEASARKDREWFKEFSKTSKPGVPLPFDEKLGLTKEEYAEYLALWKKREFRDMEEVVLLLRESTDGTWALTATGSANILTTLRYNGKEDVFLSPNGTLKRIDDIDADADSVLGAWTGSEWKFEEENTLGKTKENFALGRFGDKKYGLIVYRVQEVSTEGTRLLDKSLVIRFPLGKDGKAKSAR